MTTTERVQNKFWGTVALSTPTDCWLWHGPRLNSGYGVFYGPKGWDSIPAHRVAWILTNGDIHPGLHVCHTCDVRLCVNPSHLFLGTSRDNIHDMIRKGRWVGRVPINPPPQCHPDRSFYARGMCRPCYRRMWRSCSDGWRNQRGIQGRKRRQTPRYLSSQSILPPALDVGSQPPTSAQG